jgi:hypothetical protein
MKFGLEKLELSKEDDGRAEPPPPNAASNIGRGSSPGLPVLSANVVPPLIARLVCAFLNSFKKPFSKIFTSFRSKVCHMCTE